MPLNSEYTETMEFIAKFDLCLQFSQVPRSPDLAIFVSMTIDDDTTDYFTPCVCMWGNYRNTLVNHVRSTGPSSGKAVGGGCAWDATFNTDQRHSTCKDR